VKLRLAHIISFLAFAVLAGLAQPAKATSISDFFKKLGESFSHPRKHPTPSKPHPTSPKPSTEASPYATPTPTASPEATIRAATVATDAKNPKRDTPYGIPVADKPGFVTSPYSPTQGYVDVRGIPSGTEVKDPFTGKIFRTP
jgi:hypothetical protein